MSDDEFTRLFKYMQERFDVVENKLDQKASQSSVDNLIGAIDTFIRRLDTNESEQAARDA
ncbi:MAG TPA: hypothetical protein VFL85_02130 [Candidatus Saccharimonadales bacterium]|nr:hypothetical protein [Candidatus Saccharimonadales bacterium]